MEHTIRLHPLLACIRRLFGLGETDLQYINGPQTLPAPLSREDEAALNERIETDEEGNDVYATIDDDDELDAVFEKYLEIAEADEEDAEE